MTIRLHGSPCPASTRSRRDAARGLTLIEVTIAIAVLVITLLGLFASILSASGLLDTARERERAATAALARIDAMRATPFDELLERFGPGSEGANFAVPGLDAPSGRPAVGRVVFLRESARGESIEDHGIDTYFGEAADLNEDGDTTDGPSADATMHGVVVEIVFRARGAIGEVRLVFPTILEAQGGAEP